MTACFDYVGPGDTRFDGKSLKWFKVDGVGCVRNAQRGMAGEL